MIEFESHLSLGSIVPISVLSIYFKCQIQLLDIKSSWIYVGLAIADGILNHFILFFICLTPLQPISNQSNFYHLHSPQPNCYPHSSFLHPSPHSIIY